MNLSAACITDGKTQKIRYGRGIRQSAHPRVIGSEEPAAMAYVYQSQIWSSSVDTIQNSLALRVLETARFPKNTRRQPMGHSAPIVSSVGLGT